MAIFGNLDFNSVVRWFDYAGGFDVLLPFLLIFTVVFAILEKANILGEKKKNLNVVIAFIIGALLVSQTTIVNIILMFIPRVSLVIVISLMAMLLIALFGGTGEWTGFVFGLAAIFSIVGIIWALIPATYYSADWPYWLRLDEQDKAVLLTVFVFVLVIWFITKEPDQGSKVGESFGKFIKQFEEGFKGRGRGGGG